MRIAAIDCGTNSIHMIVVRIRPDLSFEVIDREKEMVRLGSGGLDGKALTPEAMAAALQAFSRFRRLAESHQVEEILAAATSAVREAENGGEFLAAVEQETGIKPQVISGTEEARLIHLAAVYGVDVAGVSAVVVDIGGGSVEITHGDGTALRVAKSFKLGVIRLTERFVRTDPLSGRDERRLVRHIDGELSKYLRDIKSAGFDRVIGTSGTILSLGTVASTDRRRASDEIRNLRVPAKQIHRLRKELIERSISERMKMPGLDPRRADLIVSGAVLLDRYCSGLGRLILRCAIWLCAKGSFSTTSSATGATSRRPVNTPTCGAEVSSSWQSGAATGPSTPTRWRGCRCRSSIRPAAPTC